MAAALELFPLMGLPMVEPGDDVAGLIADGIRANGLTLAEGDVVVIAQKIVSKAEDRYVRLSDVQVSERSRLRKIRAWCSSSSTRAPTS